MILSRVIEHVKAQNWLAIAIDFVIVIVGVFIGIQLGNWNGARVEQIEAANFHERLTADMRLEAANYKYLQGYYRSAQKSAETAYKSLTGEIDISDADLLINAFRASQYNWMERQRATFDELVASGNFDLIADTELRTRVTGYYSTTFLEEIAQDNKNSEYRIAFRKIAPPDLQLELSEQCGDKPVEGAPAGIVTIDYPCTLDWPQDRIEAAADILRSDAALPSLLRLRIANLGSRDYTMEINYESYGLGTFSETEPAP